MQKIKRYKEILFGLAMWAADALFHDNDGGLAGHAASVGRRAIFSKLKSGMEVD